MTRLMMAVLVSVCLASAAAAARGGPARGGAHVVKMVLQDGEYRFDPAVLEVKPGDSVTFVLVGGAPHNVAFDASRIPDAAEPALSAALPGRMAPLAGPLLTESGARYTIVLKDVPPGTYAYFCMPHMAMGMTGELVVR